jgi:hypothetical protein
MSSDLDGVGMERIDRIAGGAGEKDGRERESIETAGRGGY